MDFKYKLCKDKEIENPARGIRARSGFGLESKILIDRRKQ